MEETEKLLTIDEYIGNYPPEIQERLKKMKTLTKEIVPDAEEKISWGMPSFLKNGYLIQFAAHKNHIGLYPGPEAIEEYREKLTDYKTSKGSIQLPFDKPIPNELIKEMIRFNLKKNNEKATSKKKSRRDKK